MKTDWLSFLRSGTGMVLGCMLAAYWHDFERFHHPVSGLVDAELLLLLSEGPMPSVGQLTAFLQRYTGVSAGVWIGGLASAYMACCVLLAVGWRPRWVAAALLLLHHAVYIAIPAFSYGVDFLAMSALACCCVAPAQPAHPANSAARLFLQLLLCVVYFMGGYDKFGSSWFSGEALWKALHLPGYAGWASGMVAALPVAPGFWAVGGTIVVWLELAYPVCVWFRFTRRPILAAAIAMHVAIACLLGLYYFSAMMIVLNVSAFVTPITLELRPATRPIRSPTRGGSPLNIPSGELPHPPPAPPKP